MNLLRVYADGTGETHLARIELPEAEHSDDGFGTLRRRALRDIPATTMNINENLERRPKLDLHPAPRRQLVILLQGEFEVVTTSGESYRFQPGDCLLADDVDGKGHIHEDTGEQPSVTISVGVPADWTFPGT
jgi:quercetin dioxygenase-like cupin family protein